MVKSKYDRFHDKTSVQYKLIQKNNFTYRLLLQKIDKYLKPNSKVLDIGCGAGTLSLYTGSKGSDVLGIDIAANAIGSAKKSAKFLKLSNVKFKVMDFPNQIPEGKFDFIIFTEVIEHLEDDNKALLQICNLLSKNGIVFISTPSKNAPLHRLGYAKGFDERVGHLRRYTIEELSVKCKVNGLKIMETKKIEGVIRNFLFLSPTAGKLVRFVKFFLSDLVTFVDNLTVPIFGESNIIVVAKKL